MSDDFEIVGDKPPVEVDGVKEWRSVVQARDGRIWVTVTLARGKFSAKATARTMTDLPAHKRKHTIRKAAVACRDRAWEMLLEVSSLDLDEAEGDTPAPPAERHSTQQGHWATGTTG